MSISYSILQILKVVVSERKFYNFEVCKDEIISISKKKIELRPLKFKTCILKLIGE